MFCRVAKREALNFDCADFKSKQISIVNIENKSKGVIANAAMIKKGTLLCASKALSAVFEYTNDGVLDTDTDMFANLIAPNGARSLFDAASLLVVSWRWFEPRFSGWT